MQKRDILKWFQFLRHSEPIREKASATVLFCFGWSLWIGHKLLLESRKYRFKYKKPRDRRKLGSVPSGVGTRPPDGCVLFFLHILFLLGRLGRVRGGAITFFMFWHGQRTLCLLGWAFMLHPCSCSSSCSSSSSSFLPFLLFLLLLAHAVHGALFIIFFMLHMQCMLS